MNIKKYLQLSDSKLNELENSYNYLPDEHEINTLGLSIDRSSLKETVKIARLHAQQRQSIDLEKNLSEKRRQAIRSMFVRPKN